MGMSRAVDDARDAVDARGFNVAADDLWEIEADPLVDLDETRVGMVVAVDLDSESVVVVAGKRQAPGSGSSTCGDVGYVESNFATSLHRTASRQLKRRRDRCCLLLSIIFLKGLVRGINWGTCR